jgi:lysophospholipase L1-like esterase
VWRRRARLGIGLAFAVVTLALVEIALRLYGVPPAYQPAAVGSWRMAANLDNRESRGPRDGHSFRVTTNADGLRTSLPHARTPGVERIAVMGDSTVFGWGVDDGGTLADGVQAGFDPAKVEILNAGQPGYSTTQAAWLFDQVVADYRPDRVVLFIPMHDFNRVLVSDREYLRGGDGAVARTRVWLARESRIYEVLRRQLFALTEEAFILPDRATNEPRVPRVSDAERTENVLAMQARLAAWGGRVLVGFLPFIGDFDHAPGGDRPGLAWARDMAEQHGIATVDVRASGAGRGSTGLVLADDPGHLTAEGNRLAGLAVAEVLKGP